MVQEGGKIYDHFKGKVKGHVVIKRVSVLGGLE
jgi:hypothetical protein